MKKIIFLTILNIAFNSVIAQVDIATARNQGIGANVTITGVVTNGDELGVIRYIQDNTAGMALYDASLSSFQRGDEVTVSGTLVDYNGLLEMNPVNSNSINSSGNTVSPQIVTPNQIGESTESELVQIDNVIFNNGGAVFTANTTFDFTSNNQTGRIYIKTGHTLVGRLIPMGPVTLIGISSQHTYSVPPVGDYQILPRDTNDIVQAGSIVFTSGVTQSNITTSSFDLSWSTSLPSSTNCNYDINTTLSNTINITGANQLHTISLTGLQPATFYYVECYSVNGTDTAFSSTGIYSTASNSSGKIRPYFNYSVDNSFSTGVDAQNIGSAFRDTIAAYIDLAQNTLDICVYNASSVFLANAINDAYDRGVQVRYIADDDAQNLMLPNLDPNIPVVIRDPSPAGIMHNKFIIVDANSVNNSWVMGGSTNWTDPSNLLNDYNNIIFIQDQAIAKAYTLEFEEMWGGVFGTHKLDNTPHKFNLNGVNVEVYFSPSDRTTSKILDLIKTANQSVEFGLLSFTRDDLGDAIINQDIQFGVTVRGIIESKNSSNGGEYDNLVAANVNVRSHEGVTHQFHHKYLIVDANLTTSNPAVLTGSHNWSNNAENNSDENTLIIHDQTIANIYLQEFTQRFNELSSTNLKALENLGIDIFPNPTNGRFYFSNHELIDKIMVYNNLGELVYETSSCSSIEIKKKGIYLVKILNDKSEFFKKIVIN